MSETKRKVPKLRFPGFMEDWEQRKLGECSAIITGGTPSTRILEYWSPKEIPWMSSGEINKKRISKTEDKISKLGLEQSSARWVKKNSILIALAGQGKTRGTVAINEVELTTNQSIAAIELDNSLNTEFVFQNLDSRYDELRKESSGDGTRGGLNKKIISDLYIPYTEYKEQDVIGYFFKKLDNLITLHQRKLENLKLKKKALLQKLFPKNGMQFPELRFPGFTDAWEQRKLGEITVNIGKRNKDNLNLEPYAITKDDGFIPQADAHDEFGYMKETDRKAYNIVKPNSFGYNPARINVGSIGYYSGSEDIIVSSLYEIFQTSDNIYDRFLWQWLKSKQFQNWIERLQEGSVRLYFYYDKLCECEIFIPTVDEQIKIGNSLDRLDNLITLHQCKYFPSFHNVRKI